jgi:phosphoglycolate phosphatase
MLELDGLFDAVYALKGYDLPENVDPGDPAQGRGGRLSLEEDRRRGAASDRGEAEPRRLRRVLRDFGLEGPAVLYVGDNPKKDMPVAQACGAVGVWAEYGTYISKEYRERLAVISAKAVTRRHVADVDTPRWPLAIASFVQILDILDGARWTAPRKARSPLHVRQLASRARSSACASFATSSSARTCAPRTIRAARAAAKARRRSARR